MDPRLTPERYREIVGQIPDKDVVSIILAKDAELGEGNEYSMFLLNSYFEGQLPTQQITQARQEEREEAGLEPLPQEEGTTVPSNIPQLPEHFVESPYGKTPDQASDIFDSAVAQKKGEFLKELEGSDLSVTERNVKAHRNAVRYVRDWFDIPVTAAGRLMPAAQRGGIERIMRAQGLGKVLEAMKPRTWSRADIISGLQAAGQTGAEGQRQAREARKLLQEFFWAEEDEARYMEVRPEIRAQAQAEVREEDFSEIASQYLQEHGFEFFPDEDKWRRTQTFEIPGGNIGYLGTVPDRTEVEVAEIETPKSFDHLIEQLNEAWESDPAALRGEPGPDAAPTIRVLAALRDVFNERVDKAEARIVGRQRQEDARAYYSEALELVRDHFEREGTPLPSITPGRLGSEQRAIFDELPQELKDNYSSMMEMAINMGRQKTQEHDFVVYGDYLEEELGMAGEGDRMQIELPWPGPNPTIATIDYDPDDLKTRFFGGAKDLGRSVARYDTHEGEIAETWVGAGFRDLVSVWQLASNPVFRTLTYDVDKDGNPLDPDDWNYRFDMWTERALERMQEDPDSFGSAMRYAVDVAGTTFASLVPSRMAKEVGTGTRGRVATGNYWTDVAVAIHNGRFLGDDFSELKASTRVWENWGAPWVPGVSGLMAEVALPLTPIGYAGKAFSNAGRTLQRVDQAIKTNKLSDFMAAMRVDPEVRVDYKHPISRRADPGKPPVGRLGRLGRVLESPLEEARVATLAAVGRNVVRTARGVERLAPSLDDLIAQEARLPRQLAVRLSGELLGLLETGKGAAALNKSLEAIRAMHWGENSKVMEILEDIAGVSERLEKAKKSNSIADLKTDPQGLSLLDEIGARSSMGEVFGTPEFMNGVLHGYLTNRMTLELLNYVPNRYVMVTKNIIMPIAQWKRIRKQVEKEVSSRLKVDEKLVESGHYKFTDADDAADLMASALGPNKIKETPALFDIYKRVVGGKSLTLDEYVDIEELLRGAVVKKYARNTYRLTHTSAAWESAFKARTGRQLVLPNVVKDLVRGVGPIRRVDAMLKASPTPPPARVLPKSIIEGVELPKIDLWNEITDKFADVDRVLREEILAARTETGDPWLAMASVMQKYGGDSAIDDIMAILLGGANKRGGGFFGLPGEKGIDWNRTKAALEKHLNKLARTAGPEINTLTPQAITESIAFLRKMYPDQLGKRPLRGGQPAGMGGRIPTNVFSRFWVTEGRNYKRISASDSPAKRAEKVDHNAKIDEEIARKSDYADKAVWAFIVNGRKSRVVDEAAARLNRLYPELTIPISRPTTAEATIFRDAVRGALTGVKDFTDPEIVALVDDLVRSSETLLYKGARGIEGGLNASDMRYALKEIIMNLYEEGALNFLSYQRVADALVRRAGGLKEEPGLAGVVTRATETKKKVRRILKKHLRKSAKGRKRITDAALEKARLDELTNMITGRIIATMVEANTGQTIDTLMGNLASVGLSVRIDNTSTRLTHLRAELTMIGDEYAILMPNMLREVVNPQELMLLEDLIKQNASGMLEAKLENLRKRDVSGYRYIMDSVGNAYYWSRRTTIGGLLGGFGPFAALRFHGVNVFTAPFIMAITTPQLALNAVKAIPEAATSFVKPATEALYPPITKAQRWSAKNIPGAAGAFNWMAYKFSRDPNKIMFVDKMGSVWTRARFEAAVNRSNIRFSQVSFEFRDAVIEELRRAAALNPDLSKASYMRQIWRWFDPSNKSLWGRWAEESDMAFRKAAFAAALKDGLPMEAAAKLARNALLDYGAIPKHEREKISKHMLFYAFKRQMLMETLATFLRGGDSARLLRAQMAFSMNQHKMMETWALEEDWMRTRLFAKAMKKFDSSFNYLYGPELPALGALSDIMNIGGGMIDYFNWAAGNQKTVYMKPGELLKNYQEGYFAHPWWDFVRDIAYVGLGRGGDLTPQGMVRPEWVHFWQNTGQWALMQDWFDIQAVPHDRRKSNEYLQLKAPDGTPMASQWRFGSKGGRMAFLGYYYGLTMIGANRAIRDWSTNALIGADSDDIVWKKSGLGWKIPHLVGMATIGELPSEGKMLYNQLGARTKELIAITKD